MNFLTLRQKFFSSICFTTDQIYAWSPRFDKNNLSRWVKKGLLVKVRNGFYSFPEYIKDRDTVFYLANRIYSPSYISLQTALSFYGMIPEGVITVTSISTRKTTWFETPAGRFHYQSIRPGLMAGYDQKPLMGGASILIATPEKALIDLLYLNPFYRKPEDFVELRLDDDFLRERINPDQLIRFAGLSGQISLVHRTELMIKTYNL